MPARSVEQKAVVFFNLKLYSGSNRDYFDENYGENSTMRANKPQR